MPASTSSKDDDDDNSTVSKTSGPGTTFDPQPPPLTPPTSAPALPPTSTIQQPLAAQLKSAVEGSSSLLCPLCQDKCLDVLDLRGHLMSAHKVSMEERVKTLVGLAEDRGGGGYRVGKLPDAGAERPPATASSEEGTRDSTETPGNCRREAETPDDCRREVETPGACRREAETPDDCRREAETPDDCRREAETPDDCRREMETSEDCCREEETGTFGMENHRGETGAAEDSRERTRTPEQNHTQNTGTSDLGRETPGTPEDGTGTSQEGPEKMDVGDDVTKGDLTSDSVNTSSSLLLSTAEMLGKVELDLEQLEEAHNRLVKEYGVTTTDTDNSTLVLEEEEDEDPEELYRCQICAADFPCIEHLYLHQRELGHLKLKQTPRGPGYLCFKKGCNQYFKTLDSLHKHFRGIHQKKAEGTSATMTVPVAATATSMVDGKFQCRTCSQEFSDQASLKSHGGLCHGFECRVCLLRFKDAASSESHTLYHCLKSVASCAVCSKPCKTAQQLRSHVREDHADLGAGKIEEVLKAVEDSVALLASNPDWEQFLFGDVGSGLSSSSSLSSLSLSSSAQCSAEFLYNSIERAGANQVEKPALSQTKESVLDCVPGVPKELAACSDLSLEVNSSDVDKMLSLEVNSSEVDKMLSLEVNSSEVDKMLSLEVNSSEVDKLPAVLNGTEDARQPPEKAALGGRKETSQDETKALQDAIKALQDGKKAFQDGKKAFQDGKKTLQQDHHHSKPSSDQGKSLLPDHQVNAWAQRSVEDSLNAGSIALEKYKDPSRIFKCHPCKMGFTTMHHLTVHRRMSHRVRDTVQATNDKQRYKDPTRPHKCLVCKMSFTQKNALLVHFNSAAHLCKVKAVAGILGTDAGVGGTVSTSSGGSTVSVVTQNRSIEHPTSRPPVNKRSRSAAHISADSGTAQRPINSSDPEGRVPHSGVDGQREAQCCDICHLSFRSKSDLQTHFRSVTHQNRVVQLCGQIMNGQVGVDRPQPLGQPEEATKTMMTTLQQQQMMLEMLRQQQLSLGITGDHSLAVSLSAAPCSQSVSSESKQHSSVLSKSSTSTSSSTSHSSPLPTTVVAAPAAIETDPANHGSLLYRSEDKTSVKKSKQPRQYYVDTSRLQLTDRAADTPLGCFFVKMDTDDDVDSVSAGLEKKSKKSGEHHSDEKFRQMDLAPRDDVDFPPADPKMKSREHSMNLKPKLKERFTEPLNCFAAVKMEAEDDVDSASVHQSTATALSQVVLKSEMSTNTMELPLPVAVSKSSDFPSNPILAASVPNIPQPRGFMGRFKPHLQRNLLENFGFECVMQFNENTQPKRKDKGKDKEAKSREGHADSADGRNAASEPSQRCENSEEKDGAVKSEVDLPEINKSICLLCGRQFSSIFVLKTHEEDVHKKMMPTDVVEEFGQQFRKDLEKKQPPPKAADLAGGMGSLAPTFSQSSETAASSALSVTSSTVTTASGTSTISTLSTADNKASAKSTKEDMPPPPPPLQQMPYDMAQLMPMLSMMHMPLNLLMPSGSMEGLGASFPMGLGLLESGLAFPAQSPFNGKQSAQSSAAALMEAGLPYPPQSLQQSAASAAAAQNKRGRTRISDDQLKILRAHFDINNSPTEAQIGQLADLCGLPYKVIKHWFRNTLFKERQKNKDSPYNFSNPPSTSIDLEEYEKTGRMLPAAAALTKEPLAEEDELFAGREENGAESDLQTEAFPQLPLLLPKQEPLEDRREYESRSEASTPSSLSSIPSAPPHTIHASLPCSPASLLDAQAIVLAREAAAAAHQVASTKRANRTRFSDFQVKVLQECFEQNPYPKDDELDHLSNILKLNPRVIVVWFQNARQKARKVQDNHQPSAEAKDASGIAGAAFQRTAGTAGANHCEKCGAVFQRYYELIKHQKHSCLLSENNNNKPNLAFTDDDSFSSWTSMEDSGLMESINLSTPVNSQKEGLSDSLSQSANRKSVASSLLSSSPLALAPKALSCEKCSKSFSQWDQLQLHQKVQHSASPSTPDFSHAVSVSPSSAFGMLQTLARHEDLKASESVARQQQQQRREEEKASKENKASSESASSVTSSSSSPSSSSPPTTTTTITTTSTAANQPRPQSSVSPVKHKLEVVMDQDQGDDQPKDKRLRTTILPEQLDYLFQKYQQDCNPSRKQLELISEEVRLKKRVVQVWFQNTRARERKGQPRTHQQLTHKRCPFCTSLFRARSALESHLVTKHPAEMAMGEVNIDAIPDAILESSSSSSPQTTPGLPVPAAGSHQTSAGSGSSFHSAAAVSPDVGNMFGASAMNPYFSFMPPSGLMGLGFPPGLPPPDSVQLSMQHLYEDAYKKYITELSGTVLPSGSVLKIASSSSSAPEDTPTTTTPSAAGPSSKGSETSNGPAPSTSFSMNDGGGDDDDAPLDLSVSVRATREPRKASTPASVFSSNSTPDRYRGSAPSASHTPANNSRHRSRSPHSDRTPTTTTTSTSQSSSHGVRPGKPASFGSGSDKSPAIHNSSREQGPIVISFKDSFHRVNKSQPGPLGTPSPSSSSLFKEKGDPEQPEHKPSPITITYKEKLHLEQFERKHSFKQEQDSCSESQSELSDSQLRGGGGGDIGSCPSSPKQHSGSPGAMQKRHRTQMSSLQVKVMKLLFVDYKTPTMAECELVGHQIGLAKRVVQVWFQNARAKEKKARQTASPKAPPGEEFDYPKTPEECLLCRFQYSHKFTLQDHIFTQQHITNIKDYVLKHGDLERDLMESASISGLSRQPRHPSPELDSGSKAWEKLGSSLSPQQLNQLQQGLNAAALGLSSGLPGLDSPFSLGSQPSLAEGTSSKDHKHKNQHSKKEKKKDSAASSSTSSKTVSSASTTTTNNNNNNQKRDAQKASSQKHHHHQQQQQQQQQAVVPSQPTASQQAAAAMDMAQMMALGGYLPGLDPASYLGYMYPGLPPTTAAAAAAAFFPGLMAPAMPLLQPSLLSGAEYMLAHDPLTYGTPLPLLQIPPQAIRVVSEKVGDPQCTRTHYTQDCKSLADLRGAVGSQDAGCFAEWPVDVGYICRKCQMVFPALESCLAHQHMFCYPGGEAGAHSMVKLEQLQYQCRRCGGDKFSTVSEVKAHCRLESHRSRASRNKVNNAGGGSVSSSVTSSSVSSSSASSSSAKLNASEQTSASKSARVKASGGVLPSASVSSVAPVRSSSRPVVMPPSAAGLKLTSALSLLPQAGVSKSPAAPPILSETSSKSAAPAVANSVLNLAVSAPVSSLFSTEASVARRLSDPPAASSPVPPQALATSWAPVSVDSVGGSAVSTLAAPFQTLPSENDQNIASAPPPDISQTSASILPQSSSSQDSTILPQSSSSQDSPSIDQCGASQNLQASPDMELASSDLPSTPSSILPRKASAEPVSPRDTVVQTTAVSEISSSPQPDNAVDQSSSLSLEPKSLDESTSEKQGASSSSSLEEQSSDKPLPSEPPVSSVDT